MKWKSAGTPSASLPFSLRLPQKTLYVALLLATVFLTFVVRLIDLSFFEFYLYDVHYRLRTSPAPSGNLVLVLMDGKTLDRFNEVPKFVPHQAVFKKIVSAKPKAIAYVTPIAPTNESGGEYDRSAASPTGDDDQKIAFADSLRTFDQVFQLSDTVASKDEEKPKLPAPFQFVKVLSAPKTADNEQFAKDRVTRRMAIDFEDHVLGHVTLARLFNAELDKSDPIRHTFDVLGTRQTYIDFGRPGSIPTIKFEDVLDGKYAADAFTGKLVLIGDDFQKNLANMIRTPFDRSPVAMTYLDMHANMLETMIRNSAPIKTSEWFNFLMTALVSLITIVAVLTMRPAKGMLVLLSTLFGVAAFSMILFMPFGLWMPLAHPLLAAFLCYYFFIPYRLIVENRRSWEYYQKHQLLQQVEVLKTNFISMMSHDLKTPIARIQGMTDVILKDQAILSSGQREAVDHIRSSGNDLLRFINAILNYAKIESEGVELHTESRDVNELLNAVVHKNEFLAKLKSIELIAELEPLFSIKIDPELMKQVFSNLVENAIKYSPDSSKILITSEEKDGYIVVQVSDQGPGIPADELPNVFMKFFRSRNAKASPIKGSGLGLYLAKYFVELHKGRISVESQVGQGSTFTVELPLQSNA